MIIDFKLSPVVVQYLRYYMIEETEFLFSFGSHSIHYDFIRNLLQEKPVRVKTRTTPELVDVQFKINECDYPKGLDLRYTMWWVPPTMQEFFNNAMLAAINNEYYAFITGYMTNHPMNGRKEAGQVVENVSKKFRVTEKFKAELIQRLENNHENKRLRLKVPIESFKRKFGFTDELFPYEAAKKRYYRSVNRGEENKDRVKGLIFRVKKNKAEECTDSSEGLKDNELEMSQLDIFNTSNSLNTIK